MKPKRGWRRSIGGSADAACFSRRNTWPENANERSVLDIGTGTGSNLRMLRAEGYRNVTGIDLNPLAVNYCLAKGFTSVLTGDATNLPFAEGQLDIMLATDTIEHIDDDRTALQEIHRVLCLVVML